MIRPSVIEVLTHNGRQRMPQLGILLGYETHRCWTVLTNGHLVTHGLHHIRLNLASTDAILKAFNSNPITPPGLSSKTMERMDGIPEILGAINDISKSDLQVDYFNSLPLPLKRSKYNIDELTDEFKKIKSDNYITCKWATYRAIMKALNLFKISQNPLKGLEIECFSKEDAEFYSSIGAQNDLILQFIKKATHHHHSYSDFELRLIKTIKNAAISSNTFPDIYKTVAFDVLRKTGKYSANESDLILFLKDTGLVAPWETFIGKYSSLNRLEGVPVVQEEEITKPFEDFYADKIINALKGKAPCVKTESFPWLAPVYVPEGGIVDLPADDVCSNFRKDFGDLPVYVIDGGVVHEVDDGFSIERTSDGVWIHVHIADPTAYLSPNHPLSLFAQMRHSSIYFQERHLPLIPQKLTDNVLNLGTSPFAITFSAKFQSNGDIMDFNIQPSVLRNIHHITYSDADVLLDQDDGDLISRDLKEIKKLMDKHIEYRSNQGALNAEIKGEIQIDPYPFKDNSKFWTPSKTRYPRILLDLEKEYQARTMVSECMIIAGRVAARFFSQHGIPALYRGQEAPNLSKEEGREFDTLINSKDAKTGILPVVESNNIVKYLVRATLDTKPISHFAMGLDKTGYIKLSSPLRRFTDLIHHWNLKAFWAKTKYPFSEAEILSMIHRTSILDKEIKNLSQYSDKYWLFEWIRRRQVLLNGYSDQVTEGKFLPHESEFGITPSWKWCHEPSSTDYPLYEAFILGVNPDRKSLNICLPAFANLISRCTYSSHTKELYVGNKINVRIHSIDPGILDIKLDHVSS